MMFHNVEELEETDNGYILWRVPASLRSHLSEAAAVKAACFATGVEIRFVMKSDKVTLTLRTEPMEEAQVAYIYFGAFQGGWQQSSVAITGENTSVTITRPDRLEQLKEIAENRRIGFSPEVVRIVLPSGLIRYVGVEGEVEPPDSNLLPQKTYLAYGSSITHGSLGLAMPFSYVFRISQILNCDYINMGFPGTALMEKEMAEYLCARQDWDFASLEMGVNMLKDGFTPDFFEEQVRAFTKPFADDGRIVFATDVFGYNGHYQELAAQYRRITRQVLGKSSIHYTPGLSLLNNPVFISQDMTHPSAEGQLQIADHWSEIMQRYFQGD